ncbi:MAG: HAD family hydrolase [Eubacteriales bacterium]|nr:HAD family hydrolase [Eubacteriales bacterium]
MQELDQTSLRKMKNELSFVALDLDGTLLNPERQVSAANKQAVLNCLNAGLEVFIVTGRPYQFAKLIRDDLAPEVGIISFVGTHIDFGRKEQTSRAYPFEARDVRQVLDLAKDVDIEIYLKTLDTVYSYNAPSAVGNYPEDIMRSVKVSHLQDLPCEKILKIIFYPKKEGSVENFYQVALEELTAFTVTDGGLGGLEILPEGRDKGNAILEVLSTLGLTPEQAIAFGDADNDRAMLATVAYGVAMGNAFPKLKEEARYHTKSNAEDGVAYFLNRILKEG